MNEWLIIFKLILATLLGAIIGIERESTYQVKKEDVSDVVEKIGGMRTYSLIALLGALGGIFLTNYPLLSYIILAGFSLLIICSYLANAFLNRALGLTTEISSFFAFITGLAVATEILPFRIAVATTILVVLILSQKKEIESTIEGLKRQEILNLISFAIVALVILPFLPNQGFSLLDIPLMKDFCLSLEIPIDKLAQVEIINPFRIWVIVVLVSGINLFSYYLSKFLGSGGKILTALGSGFFSSTALTQSLAIQSRKDRSQSHSLAGLALLGNASSFIEIMILILPLSPSFFSYGLWPLAILTLSAALFGILLVKKSPNKNQKNSLSTLEKIEPFSLKPALKFALVLILVKVGISAALAFYGKSAFYLASMLAAFTGMDAIVVNLAEMAGQSITLNFALFTLIGINAVNLLAKLIYSFIQGDQEYGKWVGLGFALSISLSLLATMLVF